MKEREIRNILVIRFRRVGDSVLSMSLCHTLRKSFPNAKIDFVINKGIDSLYYNHPHVDNLIVFDKDENDSILKYLSKVRSVMRAKHYDLIVDMRSTIKTMLFSLFSFRTPYRLGRKKWYTGILLTHTTRNSLADSGSVPEQNLSLLKPLEKFADMQYTTDFRLYVSDEEKCAFMEKMKKHGIDFSRPVAVAAVATRIHTKAWPFESMTEVLRRMINEIPDIQIIFNYSADECDIAMKYHKALDNDKHIFLDIDAASLRELCAMLSNCTFFFGNEGGPRHMAQALGVPAFAIYPPGIKKSSWLPDEGEYNIGISPDDYVASEEQDEKNMQYAERMELITVERVWNRLKPFMLGLLKT